MTRIHPIHRLAGIVAGLAGALLAFTAASPAAFAEHVPPPGGYGGTVQAPPQAHTTSPAACPAGRSRSSQSQPRSSPPPWQCSWTGHRQPGGT